MTRTSPQTPQRAASSSSSPATGWRLQVRGADGRVQTLEFPSLSQPEAIRRAAARGLQVLAIDSLFKAPASSTTARGAQFPLLLFSQELLALLEAGLNITEALSTLLAKERQASVRAILETVLLLLREGKNFSDVLATYPQHFPDVYIATVRASERTGDLPHALARYIGYQVQFDAIRKKLISTAIYPTMLMVVGGFVTLFLLGYVVPKFSAVYESAGRDIPWLSTVLLQFGKVIYQHWQAILITVATVSAVLVWRLSRPGGLVAVLSTLLHLPWLKEKAEQFRLSRFYRAVSLLLASGISLPRAMGMVTGLLSPAQQLRLTQARLAVEQGQSLSAALFAADLASPVADSLIRVGERSGQMAEMLERTARFQDEDFARWVDWASRLLEPVLMTVMGLVIGAVVVLMYMPIFELAGSL